MQINFKPNLRDIFNQYDFTEETTPELKQLKSDFTKKLNKAVNNDFMTFNDIDVASTEASLESQYIGFVQGFRFARSLFAGDLFTPDNMEREA